MNSEMTKVSLWLEGIFYRGGAGHLAFLARRLSGLGTLAFLIIHVVDTAMVYFWPAVYDQAIALYRSAPFMLGEILLAAAVIYHSVNGLNLILHDTFPQWWNQTTEQQNLLRVAVISAVLWMPAAALMGRALYYRHLCPACSPLPLPDVNAAANLSLIVMPLVFISVLALLFFGNRLRRAAPAHISLPSSTVKRSGEAWSWLLMRWSGFLLVPIVWIHLLLQDVLVGVHAIDLDYVALRWATLGWRVYDLALLAFALGHGMNGLRGVLLDYLPQATWRRIVGWGILGLWLIITALGATAAIGGVKHSTP